MSTGKWRSEEWKRKLLDSVKKSKSATKKEESLAQVFSSEFCKISTNTFSYRTLPMAASPQTTSGNLYMPGNLYRVSLVS